MNTFARESHKPRVRVPYQEFSAARGPELMAPDPMPGSTLQVWNKKFEKFDAIKLYQLRYVESPSHDRIYSFWLTCPSCQTEHVDENSTERTCHVCKEAQDKLALEKLIEQLAIAVAANPPPPPPVKLVTPPDMIEHILANAPKNRL